MKETDKVCKACSTVVIDARKKEICPVCKREMEPYKSYKKEEEVKLEHS